MRKTVVLPSLLTIAFMVVLSLFATSVASAASSPDTQTSVGSRMRFDAINWADSISGGADANIVATAINSNATARREAENEIENLIRRLIRENGQQAPSAQQLVMMQANGSAISRTQIRVPAGALVDTATRVLQIDNNVLREIATAWHQPSNTGPIPVYSAIEGLVPREDSGYADRTSQVFYQWITEELDPFLIKQRMPQQTLPIAHWEGGTVDETRLITEWYDGFEGRQPTFSPGTPIPGSPGPSNMDPGGIIPGSIIPGNITPSGIIPGGIIPGGIIPGNIRPGGIIPGGVTPGGIVPGSLIPGDVMRGNNPGSGNANGGTGNPGNTSGNNGDGGIGPGGTGPGSTPPGTTPPGGTSPGSTPPGTAPPGGVMPPGGTTPPDSTPPGVTPPGTTSPIITPPGGTPPGSTPPIITPPGTPGGTGPGSTGPDGITPGAPGSPGGAVVVGVETIPGVPGTVVWVEWEDQPGYYEYWYYPPANVRLVESLVDILGPQLPGLGELASEIMEILIGYDIDSREGWWESIWDLVTTTTPSIETNPVLTQMFRDGWKISRDDLFPPDGIRDGKNLAERFGLVLAYASSFGAGEWINITNTTELRMVKEEHGVKISELPQYRWLWTVQGAETSNETTVPYTSIMFTTAGDFIVEAKQYALITRANVVYYEINEYWTLDNGIPIYINRASDLEYRYDARAGSEWLDAGSWSVTVDDDMVGIYYYAGPNGLIGTHNDYNTNRVS